MKVKAECWIKCDKDWHRPGEVFEADEVDTSIMTACEESKAEQITAVEAEDTPHRGRKRKSDE